MAVVQVCHAAGLPVNLIRALANREISTVVVNGYVPDRDLRKSGRAAYRLLNGVYTDIEAYCMQTAEDVSRAVRLGVPEDRMSVAGNLKFDSSSIEAPDAPSTERLLSELGIGPDETLLLAASTHEGEEETILAAFRKVLDRFPGVRLIIAPRHIARSRRILLLCQSTGFTAGLRSNVEGRPDVLVLDTMGEMKLLLGAVQAAFVGGTLVPVGGHNVLEPAARGVPVIFGPHTSHTTEAADALLDAGCAFKVHRADDLAEAFLAVLTDKSRAQSMGECAQSIVRAKSGALVKILQCVESMVMARSTGSRCGRDR